MRRPSSPAVTLIEVLLVVVISAVVAGLVYQSALRTVEKAKIRSAWPMLRLIDAAAKAFNRDNQRWPNDLTELTTGNYLDDPGVGDWLYGLDTGAVPARAEALRQGGPCNNKTLKRYFRNSGGVADGTEEETMPACP